MNEYNLMRDKSFSVPALLLLNEQPEQNDKYIKNWPTMHWWSLSKLKRRQMESFKWMKINLPINICCTQYERLFHERMVMFYSWIIYTLSREQWLCIEIKVCQCHVHVLHSPFTAVCFKKWRSIERSVLGDNRSVEVIFVAYHLCRIVRSSTGSPCFSFEVGHGAMIRIFFMFCSFN